MRLIEKWRHSDVITFSEDSISPTRSSKWLVAIATAKDTYSKFYFQTNFYIFSGRVTKFCWVIFSLSELWAENLKGYSKHPPGRIRLISFVYLLPPLGTFQTDQAPPSSLMNETYLEVFSCLLPPLDYFPLPPASHKVRHFSLLLQDKASKTAFLWWKVIFYR